MKKGLIPAIVGTAVAGAAMYRNGNDVVKLGKKKRNIEGMVATGLLGFGLAHILLGGIGMREE